MTGHGTEHGDVSRGTRTLVFVPYLRGAGHGGPADVEAVRPLEGRVEEAVGLAAAISLDVLEGAAIPLSAYRPATLFGSGKVEEIKGRVAADDVGLVVIDHVLSPVQQRNLEKEWKAKVIDRTGLILEIFGERAQTAEGRLQVELAHLNYQRSRLVRSWTHLERQRGGFGFLGGPGETQIEADRRQIDERIARIEHDLEGVARSRRLQRTNRKRLDRPVVALVGYTNAGKSTLFNALTHAGTRAEDLLFATLDPTLRRSRLPHGTEILVSDTVGFISELPTHLVAAFRATLEEVIEADLILHVRDIAHPDTKIQAADVANVLEQLGVDPSDPAHIIEVWNKIDLLRPPASVEAVKATTGGTTLATIGVSALTGEGLPELLALIEDHLHASRDVFAVHLQGAELADLHFLYELGEVLDRQDRDDGTTDLRVRVAGRSVSAFRRRFPAATPEARA
ncbi:MAG: GTPase HflX [Bauldia sp.]|nr:GTPase HflX [Bauldia sp.]